MVSAQPATDRCPDGGPHCYCRSHTVKLDAWGTKTKRVRHCCFCGQDKPAAKDKS